MNKCKQCGHIHIIIFTETTFGHGDSQHTCYAKCKQCGRRSEEFTDHNLCDDKTIRKAQASWNKLNPGIYE